MKNIYRSKQGRNFIIAVMFITCITIMSGCKTEKNEASAAALPDLTEVTVQPVTRVSANHVISVSGSLTADKIAPLSFQASGKVKSVSVDEGDHITRGTVMAVLDSRDYQNNLDIAEADLVRAKDAYDRYEPLYREGAFAERNFVELKTGLDQAVAARDIARKALDDTILISPISGILWTKDIEIGQMVSPQVIAFKIVKTDMIYARVSVHESEIADAAIGQSADVTIPALGNRKFTGRVSMIGAVADNQTRTYPVKIELRNPGYVLRQGMVIEADITTDAVEDILAVPGRAIVRDADNLTYVFVADAAKGLAYRKRVTPGPAYRTDIIIKDGLAPEYSVIVSGQHRLRDGGPISIASAVSMKEDI